MRVEVLVVPDCPHADGAIAVVRQALDELDLMDVPVMATTVSSQAQAEQLGFIGSPTVLIDGHDPFTSRGQSPGIACRLYRDDTGVTGIPPIQPVRQALQHAAHTVGPAAPERPRA
jgi:glutaredoxin